MTVGITSLLSVPWCPPSSVSFAYLFTYLHLFTPIYWPIYLPITLFHIKGNSSPLVCLFGLGTCMGHT